MRCARSRSFDLRSALPLARDRVARRSSRALARVNFFGGRRARESDASRSSRASLFVKNPHSRALVVTTGDARAR
jgi:hypothetical protein